MWLQLKYQVISIHTELTHQCFCVCLCVFEDTGRRRRRDGPNATEAPGDVRVAQRRRGGERHGNASSLSADQGRQAHRARHECQRMRYKGIQYLRRHCSTSAAPLDISCMHAFMSVSRTVIDRDTTTSGESIFPLATVIYRATVASVTYYLALNPCAEYINEQW